jgi:uncharacterized protein YecE (DUF72 family)
MELLPTSSSFPRAELAAALRRLADLHGIFIGTSSWKYPGWVGTLYDEQRYLYRGKFAESRFERDCLSEYAEVFPSVCVDAGYYRFPSPAYMEGLCRQVPAGFRFSFKVTDDITARTFPNLPRHGPKAGQRNPHFLDADLFRSAFLSSVAPHREKLGVIIFEFSKFHPRDFERGRDFLQALEPFLMALPQDFQYGIEIRNRNLLCEPYFDLLKRHHVAHVLNHWDKMPGVHEQLSMPSSISTDFTAARLLLRPGRPYEEAVANFSPYDRTQEINEEARQAAARLIEMRMEAAQHGRQRASFIYVNNRLEGNSLNTVIAVLQRLGLLRG